MPSEAEIILHRALKYAQETHWIRRILSALAVCALLAVGLVYAYGALPRSYTISLSGGEVLGNRHFLAKVLQEEAAGNGVHVVLRPVDGTQAALEMVSKHHLDMALVPGGVTHIYPHVQQVATLAPETVHLVVRQGVDGPGDLRGKVIDLGSARPVALDVLGFLGLRENIDFAASSHSDAELVSMPAHLLPDALVVVSLMPSYLVEFLVRERGYHLLEIPFPKAMAARESWVTPITIPAATYGVSPAIPAKPMESVGIEMLLVANDRTNPAAIVKVLESLFREGVQNRANIVLSEAGMEESTGYPVSPAAFDYLNRNESVISKKTLDRAKDLFGAVMSLATSFLLVWKWFRPKPKEPPPQPTGDARVRELITELSAMEDGDFQRLGEIRAELLTLAAKMKMEEPRLIEMALIIVTDTRASFQSRERAS